MLRRLILLALGSGAALLLVTAVAGSLWAILELAGDASGAAGTKGVMLVALVLWGLDFVALVVLLALAEVGRGPVADRNDGSGARENPPPVD
jgi:hypothetical protein